MLANLSSATWQVIKDLFTRLIENAIKQFKYLT